MEEHGLDLVEDQLRVPSRPKGCRPRCRVLDQDVRAGDDGGLHRGGQDEHDGDLQRRDTALRRLEGALAAAAEPQAHDQIGQEPTGAAVATRPGPEPYAIPRVAELLVCGDAPTGAYRAAGGLGGDLDCGCGAADAPPLERASLSNAPCALSASRCSANSPRAMSSPP
ncbi:hypothetical protein [Streptomyces chartreusis]|uniref:hypothetical protein n=1 Tax=Streptomyces chartreusis TaxID=1969 RepID=UPI003640350D